MEVSRDQAQVRCQGMLVTGFICLQVHRGDQGSCWT